MFSINKSRPEKEGKRVRVIHCKTHPGVRERALLSGNMIFLHWEKALDKLKHEMLFQVIDSYGIPKGQANDIMFL